MVLILILAVLCVTPVFARKKQVVLQADVPVPPTPIPVVAPLPGVAYPPSGTPEAKTGEPVVTVTPISVIPVVPPPAPKQEKHLNELKLALDRIASLEQKSVVLESKLSAVEQKLSKVEAQLTTFINELSAPTPEEQEALPTAEGMVAVDDEEADEDGMGRML